VREPVFKNFVTSFIDLEGVMRGKVVSLAESAIVPRPLSFAASETYFRLKDEKRDLDLIPDPESVIPIPDWPDWAWVTGALHLEGAPFSQCARGALVQVLERGQGQNVAEVMTGIECEFTLASSALSEAPPVRRGRQYRKSCYSLPLLVRQADFARDIVSGLCQAGLGDVTFHPESASDQFEVSWGPAAPLLTADRHAFVKFYLRLVAGRHGLSIDFSPLSTIDGSFNAAHVHMSWHNGGDTEDTSSKSVVAARLLHAAPSLTALINPNENSYKRLNQAHLRNKNRHRISIGKRGGLIRVTSRGTIEYRQPDGVANPYLIQAAVLYGAFGAPREPNADHSAYAAIDDAGVVSLPPNLPLALSRLSADSKLCSALGAEFVGAYVDFKRARSVEYDCRPTDLDWFNAKTL